MIFVFGSGFGLYGHTAALAFASHEIATLSRYQPTAEARPEMAPLVKRILWSDESVALAAEIVALVRRPADNATMARNLARSSNAILVIEKPIATSWGEAWKLANFLNDLRRTWAVPYLLLYCDWYAPLQAAFYSGARVLVRWAHKGSLQNAAWKGNADEGGGPIAFYAIHACAVMAALASDDRKVQTKAFQSTLGMQAHLALEEIGLLSIDFRLSDHSQFSIDINGVRLFEAPSPFGIAGERGTLDPRIGPLLRFYDSLSNPVCKVRSPTFHDAVHRIWRNLVLSGGRPGPIVRTEES